MSGSLTATAPPPSSDQVARRMRRVRRADTAPEVAVRLALRARGLGYRVGYRVPVPGRTRRADVAFPGARVALYVDGCFWHSCPAHGHRPVRNAEWWARKLDAVVARDRRTDEALEQAGWVVLRVWEHEPPGEVAQRVSRVVADRRGGARTTARSRP